MPRPHCQFRTVIKIHDVFVERYACIPPLSGAPVPSPSIREKVISMLRKTHITNPNPELLNAMERLYPNHMIVCSGPDIALDLYEVRL